MIKSPAIGISYIYKWNIFNSVIYLLSCVSVPMSVCVSVSLSLCVFEFMCLWVYVSLCLWVYVSLCVWGYVSWCIWVYVSWCLCILVSLCLCDYLSWWLCVSVSICLCVSAPISCADMNAGCLVLWKWGVIIPNGNGFSFCKSLPQYNFYNLPSSVTGSFNPLKAMGGFCPLLKKSSGNPYLKILDFSNFLLWMPLWKKIFRQPIPENSWLFPTFQYGCPYEKKIRKFSFTPAQSTFGTPSTKIFIIFCFNKKNLDTNPSWNNF